MYLVTIQTLLWRVRRSLRVCGRNLGNHEPLLASVYATNQLFYQITSQMWQFLGFNNIKTYHYIQYLPQYYIIFGINRIVWRALPNLTIPLLYSNGAIGGKSRLTIANVYYIFRGLWFLKPIFSDPVFVERQSNSTNNIIWFNILKLLQS